MLLILLFTFMSFFITFFISRFTNIDFIVSCQAALMSWTLITAVYVFLEVTVFSGPIFIDLGYWFNFVWFNISWIFWFDSVTAVMLCVVCIISFFVHIFSIDYMNSDPYFLKFMSYLSLFTFFMLLLVTAGNFFQLFLGWEGVGLASYLLINFWFTRLQANKSALKAIIVNRIGDFCLYFAILLVFYNFHSLDFGVIFTTISSFSNTNEISFLGSYYNIIDVICLFIFLAATGKSAQLGLHTWLPDAMEGPTPVSALIHAATMVTAGVFVIIRCSFLFECSLFVSSLMTIIGALTIIFASLTGFFQFDIKKIIAYSTCSQLGYMIFACGNSMFDLALYHLFNHAFFKALLFLGAGSVIHAVTDEQDIRRLGALFSLLPISYISFLIGSLSLMGLPFLTGFYSKDLILEVAALSLNVTVVFSTWLALLSVFGTAYYSIRLLYYVFFNGYNANVNVLVISESNFFTLFVLISLSILSLVVGFFFKDVFSYIVITSFVESPEHFWGLEHEALTILYRLLPFVFTIFGFMFALLVNKVLFFIGFKMLYFSRFFGAKWFFDIIYNNIFVLFFLNVGYNITFKLLDRGFIEFFGSTQASHSLRKEARTFNIFHTGFLYHYLLVVVLALLSMFLFVGFVWLNDVVVFFFFSLLIIIE